MKEVKKKRTAAHNEQNSARKAWTSMRQGDATPGYKQISGITSFDNQARNDKNNKIVTIIYSFHLVISSFFMHCLFLSVFVPMVYFFFSLSSALIVHSVVLLFFFFASVLTLHFSIVQCVSRVQPQITLIILSPFFSLVLDRSFSATLGRCSSKFSKW